MREECDRLSALRHAPEEPLDTAYRRVKGWDALNLREITVLRELYAFRDDKACAWDMPVHQVASNDDLLALAQSDGMLPRGIGGMLATRCSGELAEAIRRGFDGPEAPRPERSEPYTDPWSPESRDRLKSLKRWRALISDELGLAVSHIWPTPSLERIAQRPGRIERELAGGEGEVRRWQTAEFGERPGRPGWRFGERCPRLGLGTQVSVLRPRRSSTLRRTGRYSPGRESPRTRQWCASGLWTSRPPRSRCR